MASPTSRLDRLISTRTPAHVAALEAYRPDVTAVSVRLDANEAPALLPTLTVDERAQWRDALAAIEPARYPDVRAERLRDVVARALEVDSDQLVFGCGSDALIATLIAAFGAPIDGAPASVLAPSPTFVMYAISARVHGVVPIHVPLDDDCDLDVAAMTLAIRTHRPALTFLATPNNPTSGVFSLDRVRALVEATAAIDPPGLVVIDEAYLPFRLGEGDPWNGVTGLDFLREHRHVVVLRTLSKVGLAALRVGWMVADARVAAEVDKVRLPYDLSTFSQIGATVALTTLAPVIERHVAAIVRERGRVLSALSGMQRVRAARADGNFVWLDVGDIAEGAEVQRALKAAGVLVRAFAHSPGRVRVTIGSAPENEHFLRALADIARRH